jgi:hypothetical protein
VAPRTIVLSPLSGGALTLTASGGPVDWSITESPGLIGELAVTPSSGHLLAGQSATVSLRVSAAAGAAGAAGVRAAPADATLAGATGVCVSCTLTVNPGDITVTVLIEINASPSPSKPSCPPPSSSAPGIEAVAGCRGSG